MYPRSLMLPSIILGILTTAIDSSIHLREQQEIGRKERHGESKRE